MSVVRLEHLTKVFPGGTTAVEDLTLTVADGEFLVLRAAYFFDPHTGEAIAAGAAEPAPVAAGAPATT
ncbi:hypothetical protein [Actinoplanes auranticolor]|nr:hypothetical protein [Actinoplanes auranticolor]